MEKTTFESVDAYIATFPEEVQKMLETVRAAIKKTAPEAKEIISYQMPAYKTRTILVYFAGYKKHIGFYPGAACIAHFQKEIAGYKNAKGSVQFPLDKPLPVDLIVEMVRFRCEI